MAHLDRSPAPYWQTSDPGVCLREKPDRRRAVREDYSTITPRHLNVILRRGDDFRQWMIRQRAIGWGFSILTPTSITVSGCDTAEEAVAQQRAWQSEIDTARADGWS